MKNDLFQDSIIHVVSRVLMILLVLYVLLNLHELMYRDVSCYPFGVEAIGGMWQYANVTYYRSAILFDIIKVIPLVLLLIFAKKLERRYLYLLASLWLALLISLTIFMQQYDMLNPPIWLPKLFNFL